MWAAFYRALVAKGRSDTGAPWTEPFHFEETNERGNIAIVRIPRTGMTRSAAKHDPQKSRSRRDVVREPKRNPHVEREMLLGFLEAVWLDSYMSWAEESGHGHRTGHIPQHVRGLSDIPQAPPLAAKKLAKKYASILVKMNRASLTQIWERASHADGKGADPRQLGFNLAMQSRGHGISWTDDHAPFKLALPSAEWSAYGSKGRVRVDGYVSERRPSKLH